MAYLEINSLEWVQKYWMVQLVALLPHTLWNDHLLFLYCATWCSRDSARHGVLHRPLPVILTGVTSTL